MKRKKKLDFPDVSRHFPQRDSSDFSLFPNQYPTYPRVNYRNVLAAVPPSRTGTIHVAGTLRHLGS